MVTKIQPDLSLILPAFLEEENLRILLPRINSTLKSLTSNFEILVIDTEKPLDHTHQACDEHGAVYLNRLGGNTYGAAIRTGIQHAQGKMAIFMDADGSHTPEFIANLYKERFTADIVIASRYIDGGFTENSRLLTLMSLVLNYTYALVLNLKVKDVSNSFKMYNTSQLKQLDLICENFDVVEEIIYKLSLIYPDIKIKEIPFSFKKRMFGETKRNLPLFMFNYLVTIIRLRMMKVSKNSKL